MGKNRNFSHKSFIQKPVRFVKRNFIADVLMENTVPMNVRKEIITLKLKQ